MGVVESMSNILDLHRGNFIPSSTKPRDTSCQEFCNCKNILTNGGDLVVVNVMDSYVLLCDMIIPTTLYCKVEELGVWCTTLNRTENISTGLYRNKGAKKRHEIKVWRVLVLDRIDQSMYKFRSWGNIKNCDRRPYWVERTGPNVERYMRCLYRVLERRHGINDGTNCLRERRSFESSFSAFYRICRLPYS